MKNKIIRIILLLLPILALSVTDVCNVKAGEVSVSSRDSSVFVRRSIIDILHLGGGGYVNSYGKTPYMPGSGSGPFYGPRGTYVLKDNAVNSGSGSHGGSYWKLFDRRGNRLGTYDYEGYYLRP